MKGLSEGWRSKAAADFCLQCLLISYIFSAPEYISKFSSGVSSYERHRQPETEGDEGRVWLERRTRHFWDMHFVDKQTWESTQSVVSHHKQDSRYRGCRYPPSAHTLLEIRYKLGQPPPMARTRLCWKSLKSNAVQILDWYSSVTSSIRWWLTAAKLILMGSRNSITLPLWKSRC